MYFENQTVLGVFFMEGVVIFIIIFFVVLSKVLSYYNRGTYYYKQAKKVGRALETSEQKRPSSQVYDNLQVEGKEQPVTEIYESPEWLEGVKVGYVIDGDTVVVYKGREQFKVRLYGIDCPEDGQEWGDISTAGLIKMIGGKYVDLEVFGIDMYGRALATIYVNEKSEQINVNEKMVMKGHAWVMRRFYKELSRNRQHQLNKLENWAKQKKVGLWRKDNPIPPWKWRQEG